MPANVSTFQVFDECSRRFDGVDYLPDLHGNGIVLSSSSWLGDAEESGFETVRKHLERWARTRGTVNSFRERKLRWTASSWRFHDVLGSCGPNMRRRYKFVFNRSAPCRIQVLPTRFHAILYSSWALFGPSVLSDLIHTLQYWPTPSWFGSIFTNSARFVHQAAVEPPTGDKERKLVAGNLRSQINGSSCSTCYKYENMLRWRCPKRD